MSYQVIARKYRPQFFEEVAGQEAVVTTLKNSILSQRVHCAYLFSGSRGVGKTTLARLFAKALNCQQGPTPTPCNVCQNCREIVSGSALDVQEIDGASHTSVDDIRQIRESLKYLPASGRYKIYLIDEVHMLSNSAFNALLKTLEEPPPHVIFLFATTESHKIPATILSRCQRFDLKRIAQRTIVGKLQFVCEQEKITVSLDVLKIIARESEGSLRDAQSLLDQMLAFNPQQLTLENTAQILGLIQETMVFNLTHAVLNQQAKEALKILEEVYSKGQDLRQLSQQWLRHWRSLILYRETQSLEGFQDFTEAEIGAIQKNALCVELSSLDIGFHLLYTCSQEIARSEFPKILLEVLIVRLCHLSQIKLLSQVLKDLEVAKPVASSEKKVSVIDEVTTLPELSLPVGRASSHEKNDSSEKNISSFVDFVLAKKPQWVGLMKEAEKVEVVENTLRLFFHSSMMIDLLTERKSALEELARIFWQKSMAIKIELIEKGSAQLRSEAPLNANVVDQAIESARRILGAELVKKGEPT